MTCEITGFKTDRSGDYIIKDPDSRLDYSVDWTDWLVGTDTIQLATWTISTIVDDPAPITTDENNASSSRATIWLAGGTVGYYYTITNHIVTAGGLEDERSFRIFVREK